MKKVTLGLIFIIFASQLNFALDIDNLKALGDNLVSFDKTSHDFGKVKKGASNVKTTFKYTNNSQEMVFITRVVKSCGCTEPEYSKEPLMPGQTADFKVGYTTTDIMGVFNKKLTVFNNLSTDAVILTIKGEVVEKLVN
ncbi:MAG: DUF1573 domain-containing protein [Bacteroidales bacterium]|nr:DUF1573 domain-containing protein [Bacteroidales bacterium]